MSSMVDKQEIIDMIRLKSPRLELVSFEAGKSEAWRWFKRVRVDGAVLPYAVCNGCFKPVHYTPRDGTGGLRRHACPLTVAMAQAKTGLAAKTPTLSQKKRAETPDQQHNHSGQQQQSSPRSRQKRSATVPVSLTMWAAEKGLMEKSLMELAAASGHHNPAGLPSGGLSIASAFAALQGIVPRCSPFLNGNNGQLSLSQLGHHLSHHSSSSSSPPPPHNGNSSPKMADSALDLAMKKTTNGSSSSDPHHRHRGTPMDEDDDDDEGEEEEEGAVMPLEERKERAQNIVDHILLNISQQSSTALAKQGSHDANQNEQTSRFSIVPPSIRSSSSTRRPRKRSNPDRAIPTFNGRSTHHGHPDIEANLQMLAQVANANDTAPAIKRERLSSPDPLDAFRYQVNGGQLTPTSQHSVPSPADVDGDHPASASSRSTGGSSSAKSGASSPAQFHHHLAHLNNVPASHHLVPSTSSPSSTSVVSCPQLPPSQLAKPIETFVTAMHQVLQGSPQCSLADAAQLIQLNDLTTCLHSLLDLHKKSLSVFDNRMPVPDLQKPAPQFRGIAVVDGQFKEISLDDYKGKYVVLFFYPLDFTFVCPTEIVAFSDRAEEFRKIGCELIACSTDSHFCHLAWVNTERKQGGLGALNIPLLADKSTVISKAYGVYKEDEGLTFRGLFIIDDQQRLRQVTINDLPVGRSVDETLRLVQAFQFTDKHGEVCPAGWTPGKKSMKADPAGSKEYFQASH